MPNAGNGDFHIVTIIIIIIVWSHAQQFDELEDSVRRKIFTSSIAGAQAKGMADLSRMRGFELVPGEVNFGTLREGCTYAFQVNLKNVGVDSCRYKIRQPPPGTGLQVVYTPGPVSNIQDQEPLL